jgi:hypothetical protein
VTDIQWAETADFRRNLCTICGQSAFAKLRLEIIQGAATYYVCRRQGCIAEAARRAVDNLLRAAGRGMPQESEHPDAVDVEARDVSGSLPPPPM